MHTTKYMWGWRSSPSNFHLPAHICVVILLQVQKEPNIPSSWGLNTEVKSYLDKVLGRLNIFRQRMGDITWLWQENQSNFGGLIICLYFIGSVNVCLQVLYSFTDSYLCMKKSNESRFFGFEQMTIYQTRAGSWLRVRFGYFILEKARSESKFQRPLVVDVEFVSNISKSF